MKFFRDTVIYLLIGVVVVMSLTWYFGGGPTGWDFVFFVIVWPTIPIVLLFKFLAYVGAAYFGIEALEEFF